MEIILLLYEDPESQRLVRRILEPAGFNVISAPCSPIALDILSTLKPALVVLDFRRVGESGQDLCRQIRFRLAGTPLLVLSKVTEMTDAVRLLELEADGYITKPLNTGEFLVRVRAVMRHLIC